MKSVKVFTVCEICPANHLKAEKNRVTKAVSSLFSILCFLRLSQIWSYEFFFFLSTGTKKGTNIFNSPANLRKFHRRKRNESCSKDPCFSVAKHYVIEWNFAKICIWADVNFRTCRDLSPFGNLSCGAFFSVDHFFRRRRPMNITNAVAGNPRFQHLKTVLCTNMFNGSEKS